MNTREYARVEKLFQAAADLDRDDRAAFLDEQCGSDMSLRSEVESLLCHFEQAPVGVLKTPEEDAVRSVRLQDRIGPYEIIAPLGEGGFGVVYLARQLKPIRRDVALKVIKLGMDTKQVIARFEAERQALALMDHPNIAKVFRAGGTDRGQPYFAMEYIEGIPITEFCDKERFDTRRRLELFLDVCSAVQHAHQKGIIHRDLKPSNILVALHDDIAVPKVIDFGVAKATSQDLTDRTLHTIQGQLMGTPEYMSPEQAEMSEEGVDSTTDIYSLGVILYELLTGMLPFAPAALRSHGVSEIHRILRDEEPKKPSTRVSGSDREEEGRSALGFEGAESAQNEAAPSSSVLGGERRTASRQTTIQEIARCRGTDPRVLRRELRGDMDWIVMRAMEKQRTRRYASASELAADIQRHLRHEPVLAGPPSTMYRVGKFVRRHRAGVISAALVLLVLVSGVMGTGWGFVVAKKNARISERIAYRASMATVGRALLNNDVTEARKHLEAAPTGLRGWEWRHFQSRLDQSLMTIHLEDVETNPAHTTRYWGPVSFTPDGNAFWFVSQWLTRKGPVARLRAWDLQSGKQVVSRDLESQLEWYDLDSDPDGVRVAWFAHPRSTLHVEDALTGENRITMIVDDAADVGQRPETTGGEHLVSTSAHGFSMISYPGALHWGMLHRTPRFDPTTSIPGSTTSEDGGLAVTLGWDRSVNVGEVLVWDLHTGALVQRITGHPQRVHNAVFSPDAARLVTVCEDGVIRIWDPRTGEPADWKTARGHSGSVRAVTYSPDGSILATGSQDRTIRLWNAHTGEPLGVLLGHTNYVKVLKFSPDGSILISIADDGTIRMWDPHSARSSNVIGRHDSYVYPVVYTPDGTQIASGGFDGFVRFWDAQSGGTITQIAIPKSCTTHDAVYALRFNDSATRFALKTPATLGVTDHFGRRVRVFDALSGSELAIFDHVDNSAEACMAFDAQGRWLAVAEDEQVRFMDQETLRESFHLPGYRFCAFSGGQPTLLATGIAGTHDIRLWDVEARRPIATLVGHSDNIASVGFSPDDRRVVSASEEICVWDTTTGQRLAVLDGHTDSVFSVAYSPDGRRIASGSEDHTIRIWDAETFEELAVLRGHEDYVWSVAFSPDGEQLISGSGDGTVRVWDTKPLRERLRAGDEWESTVDRLDPLVRKLLDRQPDPRRVLDRLEADRSLTDREREVARQLVLRNAVIRNRPNE